MADKNEVRENDGRATVIAFFIYCCNSALHYICVWISVIVQLCNFEMKYYIIITTTSSDTKLWSDAQDERQRCQKHIE